MQESHEDDRIYCSPTTGTFSCHVILPKSPSLAFWGIVLQGRSGVWGIVVGAVLGVLLGALLGFWGVGTAISAMCRSRCTTSRPFCRNGSRRLDGPGSSTVSMQTDGFKF